MFFFIFFKYAFTWCLDVNLFLKNKTDLFWCTTQPAITYSKLTIETLEQDEKYVQS